MRYVVTWWTRFEEIIRTQVSTYRRLSLQYKDPPLHCFYSDAQHKMSFTAWKRNPPTNSCATYWKLLHFQIQITSDVTLYVYIKLLLVSPRNRCNMLLFNDFSNIARQLRLFLFSIEFRVLDSLVNFLLLTDNKYATQNGLWKHTFDRNITSNNGNISLRDLACFE